MHPGATGNQDPRRRPGHRAPPSEQRPADLAATTASDADEARNIQAPDRRCSTRPRSSRDRSRRTVLGQRLRRLAARRPPHSRLLRRRRTHTASTTNRIDFSWVTPFPELREQVSRHSSASCFSGYLNWRAFLTVKSLLSPDVDCHLGLPPWYDPVRCLYRRECDQAQPVSAESRGVLTRDHSVRRPLPTQDLLDVLVAALLRHSQRRLAVLGAKRDVRPHRRPARTRAPWPPSACHQRRLPVFILRVDVRARRIIACTSSSPFSAAANISGVRAFYQNQVLTTVVVVFLYLLIDKTVPLLLQSTVVGLSRLRAWSVFLVRKVKV